MNAKPLCIVVNHEGACEYQASMDVVNKLHHIHIGQKEFAALSTIDRPYSMEQLLAHEMTHAGQMSVYTDSFQASIGAKVWRKHLEYGASLTPEAKAALRAKTEAAKTAELHEAQRLAEDIYESHIKPRHAWSMEQLKGDPELKHMFEKVEAPAVASENKVAALLGRPLREGHYLDRSLNKEEEVATLMQQWGIVPAPQRSAAVSQILEGKGRPLEGGAAQR